MSVHYDYYRIFYSVAKLKNITAASGELFLSQSTISRSIQKLEHEIGCKLFHRNKQGVELTAEGKLLYYHVEQAFDHFAAAENKLNQIRNLKGGSIHIGATELTMEFFLVPFLEQFKKDYPDVHIKISFGYPEGLVDRLNFGAIDLAVLTTPLETDETLSVTNLKEFQDVLIAGTDYWDLTERPVSLSELENYPFIMMESCTSSRRDLESHFAKHNVTFHSECDVISLPLIVPMVETNMGLGFIPAPYVTEKLALGTLREIQLVEALPTRQICLCTSKIYPQNAASREFISYLI